MQMDPDWSISVMKRNQLAAGRIRLAFRKTSLGARELCAVVFIVFAVSATSGFGQPEGETSSVGLQAILPSEVPEEIGYEAFLVLGGNWEEWSRDVSDEVFNLYQGELSTIADQRAQLELLRSKLAVMQRALDDARYRSIHNELITLHGRLERRVDVAEAILDTLQLDTEALAADKRRAAADAVLASLARLRSDLRSVRGGAAWLPYVRDEQIRDSLQSEAASEETVELLQDVRAKFEARGQLQPEQQRFFNRSSFQGLEESIDGYLEAAGTEVSFPPQEQMQANLADLVEALEDYEETASNESAKQARDALARIRETMPDGGERIAEAVTTHYVNYNLQVLATEEFIGRLIHERRTETGPVRDYILGANVFGRQFTNTNVGVDLRPSENGGRFDITLTGTTRSDTAGYTRQATVYTLGRHRFWASKEVFFDGHNFFTYPARISVDANNYTRDVRTNLSGWPILGWIADGIAEDRVADQRPQAEAIARQRVASRVVPRMNREVDAEFSTAERDLETGLYQRLKDAGVYPEVKDFRTSTSFLRVGARVRRENELGGATTNFALEPGPGVTIHLHESLLNNAADRLDFAGRAMTDAELQAELEEFLSTIAGREVSLEDAEPAPVEPSTEEEDALPDTFLFAESDPVRFRVENGEINLILRTGFRQQDEEDIPTKEVGVPLSFRVDDEGIHITRGSVRVAPVERVSPTRHIAQAGIIRKKIEQSIPDRTRERKVMVTREGREDLPVYVTRIRALNGWLTIWAQ